MNEINIEILQKRIQESDLFTRKFGTFTKTDYEILMFTIFMDSQTENARDYDISIALGIPESKVRSLRIKSQLLYPREINWVNELNRAITHGYYDQAAGNITITIENPNVRNLLKNKVEENYGVVGLTRNTKQLVLPVESFLLLAALSEENPDDVIRSLNRILREETKNKSKIENKSLREKFLNNVANVPSFLSTALSIYSTGAPIVRALIDKIT